MELIGLDRGAGEGTTDKPQSLASLIYVFRSTNLPPRCTPNHQSLYALDVVGPVRIAPRDPASVFGPPEALPVALVGSRPPRRNRRVPTLALYPFRFRAPCQESGPRPHKMQVPELHRHHSDWEITGAPGIRHVTETSAQPFEPPAPAHAIIAPMLLWTR